MTGQDTRQGELQALAREENLTLPYPAHYICWLEDRGRVVNLLDGTVTFAYSVLPMPTASAKAVAHLLEHVEGEYPL
jgi:hypothetical protein